MMSNSPTSLGVAIDLADTCVHPDADRCDEGRLTEVGAKTRPEVVIEVRPSMEGTGMKRQPVSDSGEERDEKGKSDDEITRNRPRPTFFAGLVPPRSLLGTDLSPFPVWVIKAAAEVPA